MYTDLDDHQAPVPQAEHRARVARRFHRIRQRRYLTLTGLVVIVIAAIVTPAVAGHIGSSPNKSASSPLTPTKPKTTDTSTMSTGRQRSFGGKWNLLRSDSAWRKRPWTKWGM